MKKRVVALLLSLTMVLSLLPERAWASQTTVAEEQTQDNGESEDKQNQESENPEDKQNQESENPEDRQDQKSENPEDKQDQENVNPEDKQNQESVNPEDEQDQANGNTEDAQILENVSRTVDVQNVEGQGYLASMEWQWKWLREEDNIESVDLPLSEAFAPEQHAYEMKISDNLDSEFHVKGTLSGAAPEGSRIKIFYTGCLNNKAMSYEQSADEFAEGKQRLEYVTNQKNMSIAPLITIRVGTETDYENYTVQLVKVPALWSDDRGLVVKDVSGKTLNISPAYDSYHNNRYRRREYSVCAAGDHVSLTAMLSQYSPKDDKDHESLCITQDGETIWQGEQGQDAEDIELPLTSGVDNVFQIQLTYEKDDKQSSEEYTLTVKQPKGLKLTVTPSDAIIYLKDTYDNRYWPDEETGTYLLANEETYTCYITRAGYIGQKLTLTGGEKENLEVTLQPAEENTSIDEGITAEWGRFQGENAVGVTNAPTPYDPDDVDLLWATRFADPSTQVSAATGCPILVDDYLITWSGTRLKKMNRYTGEVVAETEMKGQSTFSITPGIYADGMIFMALYDGSVEAFNAKTLKPLWYYSSEMDNYWATSPICYKDGYIYVGYYGKSGLDFYCLSVTDEDPTRSDEEKYPTWQYACGGMYWAGAWANDSYVAVGSNDGTLRVFDRFTGELKDSWMPGASLRSTISYDEESDRIFFTDSNVLCNAKISEDGTLTDKNTTPIINGAGTTGVSTSTVSVYKGRIYIGVQGDAQYKKTPGHGIQVYDLDEDGTMTLAYRYATPGYPQSSAMISTAYEESEGYVYVYVQYNYPPGGVVVIKDQKGQKEPVAANKAEYSQVFTPTDPLSQYCICSPIADSEGTIYFKNDSNYLMAVSSKVMNIQVVERPTSIVQNGDSWQADGLKVVANLKNGQQRDVTDLITLTKDPDTGKFIATYTYGFDYPDPNYGLKTKTTEVKVQTEGLTVTGTAVSWDRKDNLKIRLYPDTVSDADIETDIRKEAPELCKSDTAVTGQVTQNADNKRWDQEFTFEDITQGSYKLVIYKPGKYVVKNLLVTVGEEDVKLGEIKLWLYGDVNYDGIINSRDATQVARFAVDKRNFTEEEKLAADVNRDKMYNSRDATQIARYAVNKSSVMDTLN